MRVKRHTHVTHFSIQSGVQGEGFFPLPLLISPFHPLSPSSPLRARKIFLFSLPPFPPNFSLLSPLFSSVPLFSLFPNPSTPSSPLISHLPLTLSALACVYATKNTSLHVFYFTYDDILKMKQGRSCYTPIRKKCFCYIHR